MMEDANCQQPEMLIWDMIPGACLVSWTSFPLPVERRHPTQVLQDLGRSSMMSLQDSAFLVAWVIFTILPPWFY